MANKTTMKARLAFWQAALMKLQTAYIALLEGGVKSYSIENRVLTRLDMPSLAKEIEAAEKKVDELTAELAGRGARKTVGCVPQDW